MIRAKSFLPCRPRPDLLLVIPSMLLLGASSMLSGTCGPFSDVSGDAFCPFIEEIFYLGITTGTSPTTYDPETPASRLQTAAFLSRAVDGILNRGSRRASLDQFWTPQNPDVLGLTTVGNAPASCSCDGADVWVAGYGTNVVSRVRASDGRLLETWTGAALALAVKVAMGRVLVTGNTTPASLYVIDPSQPPGSVTSVATSLGGVPKGIAFDGSRIWTVNDQSLSIVTPEATIPWTVTAIPFSSDYGNGGVIYDGTNVWVTNLHGHIYRFDSLGAVLQTVTVGDWPYSPVFDGTNIWVPNWQSGSLTVVRASTGAVLQTLTGNGLFGPVAAAFDGERVLIVNRLGNSVSFWRAADLMPLGFISTGSTSAPTGVCSDGVNFWISLQSRSQLARF